MLKSKLQLFGETVKGSKLVYLFRILDQADTVAGAALAFTTENSRSVSKDADSTATKDGAIRTPGEAEIEISVTCLLKKGDTFISELEEAMKADKLIEIWEANLDDPGTESNKFKGTYYQAYLTSLELSSSAEDFTEVSLDFACNGNGASGEVTVTTEQQEAAAYVFRDSTIGG